MTLRFTVMYTDDFGKKHITFVKSFKEINFIKERFNNAEILDILKE